MSDLLRIRRIPTPVDAADLVDLGVSVEIVRRLMALAPYPDDTLRNRSIRQPSEYHVKTSEASDAVS